MTWEPSPLAFSKPGDPEHWKPGSLEHVPRPDDGYPLYPGRVFDETTRGHWRRTFDGHRIRYYWRGLRVPWLAWAMFS